jgi:predicted phosphodiesterase
MRIALLADIHGNLHALDAVLADLERQGGADALWVLGDLAALGPNPVGVLERLATLPQLQASYGNTDRYLSHGTRPYPDPDTLLAEPERLAGLLPVAESLAWAQGMVTQAGWGAWLAALPLELRTTLPDGTRVLGVHASPGAFDGSGVHAGLSNHELRALVAGCEADLVLVGHTHRPFETTVHLGGNAVRIINFGPVSMHFTDEKRAIYALLESDVDGHRLERRFVAYDRDGAIAELRRLNHPAAAFIAANLSDPHHPAGTDGMP